MKLDSPLFDRIRVKPADDRRQRVEQPACDCPGCPAPGLHRAPKGRGREGEYFTFCIDHVREYNQSYNYFAGMSDTAVAAWQKAAQTGHRPTWKIGVNGFGPGAAGRFGSAPGGADDPFTLFREMGGRARPQVEPERPDDRREGRMIRNHERRALDTLGLDVDATREDIKARFKALVKRHHPDANGGDRSTEERLREIIQAYNYLKAAGFC